MTEKPDLAKLLEQARTEWVRSYRGSDADGNGRITPAAVRAVNVLFDAVGDEMRKGAVPVLLSAGARRTLLAYIDYSKEIMVASAENAAVSLAEVLRREFSDALKEKPHG